MTEVQEHSGQPACGLEENGKHHEETINPLFWGRELCIISHHVEISPFRIQKHRIYLFLLYFIIF